MPGTDGPGQFPAHKHVVIPLVRPGQAGPGRAIFTRDPKRSVKSVVCRSSGELFFLLPHTPTHTVSESPNVP